MGLTIPFRQPRQYLTPTAWELKILFNDTSLKIILKLIDTTCFINVQPNETVQIITNGGIRT